MISSDKAGVQFPDSESFFCFLSAIRSIRVRGLLVLLGILYCDTSHICEETAASFGLKYDIALHKDM